MKRAKSYRACRAVSSAIVLGTGTKAEGLAKAGPMRGIAPNQSRTRTIQTPKPRSRTAIAILHTLNYKRDSKSL